MDRRQVEHIEAHRGDIGQTQLAVLKGAMLAGDRRARARKHLIPCAEARFLPIDRHGQFLGVSAGEPSIGIFVHELRQLLVESPRDPMGKILPFRSQRSCPSLELFRIRAAGPCASRLDQSRAREQFHRYVLTRLNPLHKILSPGFEMVNPSL